MIANSQVRCRVDAESRFIATAATQASSMIAVDLQITSNSSGLATSKLSQVNKEFMLPPLSFGLFNQFDQAFAFIVVDRFLAGMQMRG